MQLKPYQQQTLDVLRRYLTEARVTGPMEAYRTITNEPEQANRLRGMVTPYKALNGLTDTPYVCLRLPTGGGKTILAAHSVAVAKDAWLERDFPLVLWLVPTTTIRRQTVDALKNPQHPYRQALDEAFAGRVRVYDIGNFAQITPQDLKANCCIIVGTIQTLRVEHTEGRKVYSHNENLQTHFAAVAKHAAGLELIEAGKPGAGTIKFSFANLMHLHRPLMIVDEAHKAVTGLSETMQQRVNPSAIIEFTATPQRQSNLLHSVSARELKDAEMIKLPVMLAEHPTWQQAVDGAITKRQELEDIASKDPAYIRPIVLFQAQDRGQTATVDVLKSYLLDEGIAERRIAVATGDQRELDGVNLFDPACEVDFIITVEALKEGWDCSFAYVFCSLANIQSATDVEQLLGRVLRMPYASRRGDDRLNRAYAHLASPRFSEAAMALKDRMVAMGFREDEAIENIQPQHQQEELDSDLFGPQSRPKPSVTVAVDLAPEDLSAVRDAVPDKVEIVTGSDGPALRVTGFLTPEQKDRLAQALPETQANRFRESIAAYEAENKERVSPADKGQRMVVPALMANLQGELELAETDTLMEHCDWSLLDHSPQLDAGQFDLRQTANTFEIDLDGRTLSVVSRDPATQLSFNVDVEGWSEHGLVTFLTKTLRQPDLDPRQLIKWLQAAVSHLTEARKLPLSGLMQSKFVLARALGERIAAIRRTVRTQVYQDNLFGPQARPEVSYERGFVFKDGLFASARKYQGDFRFKNHFTGPDNVPAFDGKSGGDEEVCARQLDSLSSVKHWVRNVPQHPDAFWLPLAGGRFYPDFIAELTDGRLLVAEYKGEDRVTNDDTKEKVAVGNLWEKAMGKAGLFLLVEKTKDGKTPLVQMREKIGAG